MAEFAVIQQATRTTTGTQNYTSSGFGTPLGAIFTVTNGTVAGTTVAHALISFGATDGTRQWAMSGRARDNITLGTTLTANRANTSDVILLTDDGGTVILRAQFSAWTTDGVTINVSVTNGTAYRVTCTLIGGSKVTGVYVNTVTTPSVINTSTTVSTLPFESTFLIIAGKSSSNAWDDTADGNYTYQLGCVVNSGSNPHPQFSHNWTDTTGSATTSTAGELSTNRVSANQNSGTPPGVEIQNFTSTGFDATLRDTGGSTMQVGYIAVKTDGLSAKVMALDTPTSGGSQSFTGIGFTPQFGMLFQGALIANDTRTVTADSEVMGVSMFTASAAGSVAVTSDDGVTTTTNSESVTHTKPVFLRKDSGTFMDADFSSFSSGAVTLTWNTANGTVRKWAGLFVQSPNVVMSSDIGSYLINGVAAVLRNTATTWLRLRK